MRTPRPVDGCSLNVHSCWPEVLNSSSVLRFRFFLLTVEQNPLQQKYKQHVVASVIITVDAMISMTINITVSILKSTVKVEENGMRKNQRVIENKTCVNGRFNYG